VEDAKDARGSARARGGGASSVETVETVAHAHTNAAQKESGNRFAMSKYPSGVSPFHTPTATPEGSFSKKRLAGGAGTQFTCFAGTKVHILTPLLPEGSFSKEHVAGPHLLYLLYWYNQTYLLTGTNVKILTPEEQGERRSVQARSAWQAVQVLNLLALRVQKYTY